MYTVMNSLDRCGWCVFYADGNSIGLEFVAGAFESKAHADSEAFRLNKLKT